MKNTITWPQASFIGFDRIWKELDQQITQGVSNSSAFPRHNIVRVDEEHCTIEVALAGYSLDDLSIEVEGDTLVISGSKDDQDVDYIHKGISYKSFTRKFRLNESVVVEEAGFANGLLTVKLVSKLPEEKKTRKVSIKG